MVAGIVNRVFAAAALAALVAAAGLTPALPAFAQAAPTAAAKPPASIPYRWKSVQMVGGGFVDGIVFHPTTQGVRYARTDMGGAYRWDPAAKQWAPILDWVSFADVNFMGVESIAVDPRDASRVYLACGTYSGVPNTAILRSSDQGRTFARTNVPFRMGGNENGRGDGERLAVDPNDGRVLYFGSRSAGLWRSVDRAVTWQHVESFPDITEAVLPPPPPPPPPAPGAAPGAGRRRRGGYRPSQGDGIVSVVFDPRSGSAGHPSQTLYAAVSLRGRDNLFRSTDGGATWQAVPGQPTQYRANHAVLAASGVLYVSYGSAPGPSRMTDGGVWKFDTNTSAWTDITPEKPDAQPTPGPANAQGGQNFQNGRFFGYGAVSVDARHPDALIASTFGHPGGEEIFRSADAGKTWKPIFHAGGATYDFALAPYVARTPIHWLLDIEIDPADSNHALFTTGYGGYETFDLSDADAGKPTHWSVMSKGIEETVALELISPPQGPRLVSAIGDYGGFVHEDLDKPSPEGNFTNPSFGNTTGVAFAQNDPNVIVRVGTAAGGQNPNRANIGYSLNGGKTWQPPAATPQPDSASGHVAVSADGKAWVWTPDRSAPAVTRDHGATWTVCTGLPDNTRVIADPVNPQKFYGLDLFGGKLFVSLDAGATFTAQTLDLPGGLPQPGGDRFDARGGQDRLYAGPGKEADLWVAAFDGLYRSPDAGKTFVKLPAVQHLHAFGFGKGAPGHAEPALYLVGMVGGLQGVFRSDDAGQSWKRINDDQHQWGLVLQITGDPRLYGRVYVGTHGRGTVYGDPAGARSAARE